MSTTPSFRFFWLVGDQIVDRKIGTFLDMTIEDLIASPCVLRETGENGQIYYAGNDDAMYACESRQKHWRWLHSFFDNIYFALIESGWKRSEFGGKIRTNYFKYKAGDILGILKACRVLDARIVYDD